MLLYLHKVKLTFSYNFVWTKLKRCFHGSQSLFCISVFVKFLKKILLILCTGDFE